MKLYIDSTNNLRTIIRLDDAEFIREYATPRDQDTLAFIVEILDQQGVSFSKLTRIEVNPGPGSFTGSRMGVTVGNALAFALDIPISGVTPPVKPVYPSEISWKSNRDSSQKR